MIEAHGTGTQLGDPTEGAALRTVLGIRGHDDLLTLGSAKASFGHSEAPSGLLGIMKLVQLAGKQVSPSSAHLRRLNPLLSLQAPFLLPLQSCKTTSAETAGVSSFGFSGTIAHVVLRRPTGMYGELRDQTPLSQRRCSFA